MPERPQLASPPYYNQPTYQSDPALEDIVRKGQSEEFLNRVRSQAPVFSILGFRFGGANQDPNGWQLGWRGASTISGADKGTASLLGIDLNKVYHPNPFLSFGNMEGSAEVENAYKRVQEVKLKLAADAQEERKRRLEVARGEAVQDRRSYREQSFQGDMFQKQLSAQRDMAREQLLAQRELGRLDEDTRLQTTAMAGDYNLRNTIFNSLLDNRNYSFNPRVAPHSFK